MKIPIHIAEKLLRLSEGELLPSSSAKHAVIEGLIQEGIIERKGRIKKVLQLHDSRALANYLQNHHSINDLPLYIEACNKENVSRSELVSVSSDSKLIPVRTFKGFLVNSYLPIHASLNSQPILIHPLKGTFQFIYDFENFVLPIDITIVGVENAENFRYIHEQEYLFKGIKPLFICRYPQNQSKDLIKWLQRIPNNYLHFGDFDFAGISIYLNEYKKYLQNKAEFFLPDNIEMLIKDWGSRKRYDEQNADLYLQNTNESKLTDLAKLIHKYRKGLDQEVFIRK